jgi:hypothetical protein
LPLIIQYSFIKDIYKLTQPANSWKPTFDDPPKEDIDDEIQDPTESHANVNLAFELKEKF